VLLPTQKFALDTKKDLISTMAAINATFSVWRRNKLRKSWKKSCDELPLGSSVSF
jgi:hypothetical protein